MKRSIVFLTLHPVTQDHTRKYGFDLLRKRGFEVRVLNLFNWFYRDISEALPQYSETHQVQGVDQTNISGQREFYDRLKAVEGRKVAFFCLTPVPGLLSTLCELSVPYITYAPWGGVHGVHQKGGSQLERVRGAILDLVRSPLSKVSVMANRKRMEYWLKTYPPGFRCTMLADENGVDRKKTRLILNHIFDYDRYLQNSGSPRHACVPGGEYVLLLANHPWPIHDYLLVKGMRGKSAVTKDEYKKLINKAVDRFEDLTGKQVVIAGYPNATEEEDIYCGRKFVLGGDTEQLVKYATAVIGHHTGAFNFAVIHGKPVCLFNFRQLDQDSHFSRSMEMYSAALGTPVKYADTKDDFRRLAGEGIFSLNRGAYAAYMSKYIISEDVSALPVRLYWDRVADAVDSAE